MLDDLREQASDSEHFVEEDPVFEYKDEGDTRRPQNLFFGMTPVQRFVIAIMILMMVCVMGTFFLLVTEKIYLPIG